MALVQAALKDLIVVEGTTRFSAQGGPASPGTSQFQNLADQIAKSFIDHVGANAVVSSTDFVLVGSGIGTGLGILGISFTSLGTLIDANLRSNFDNPFNTFLNINVTSVTDDSPVTVRFDPIETPLTLSLSGSPNLASVTAGVDTFEDSLGIITLITAADNSSKTITINKNVTATSGIIHQTVPVLDIAVTVSGTTRFLDTIIVGDTFTDGNTVASDILSIVSDEYKITIDTSTIPPTGSADIEGTAVSVDTKCTVA